MRRCSPALLRKGAGRKLPTVAGGVLAALLSVCSLAQPSAGPQLPGSLRIEGGGTLSAGQVVRVTWGALPRETEEFELLLRCDLPKPLVVRLTESKDPGTLEFLWRVPSVPCLGARLLLRRGDGAEESVWAQSEPFLIRPESGGKVSQVAFVRGELWLPEGGTCARAFRWGAGSSVSQELGSLPEGALDPTVAPLARPASFASWRLTATAGRPPRKAARSIGRAPLDLQLRI